MIMTVQTVGESISIRLFSAELAIDAALAETAALIALLPGARAEACLSAVVGQRAFDGAAAAVGALTQARSHLVATHNTLSALARKLGLETLAIGPLDKPEDTPPNGGQTGIELSNRVNKSLSFSPIAC
jgi:hypothetical protein